MPREKFDENDFADYCDSLEYLIAVADSVAPDIAFDSEGNTSPVDSLAPVQFIRRYNKGLLRASLNYNDYSKRRIGEERIADILCAKGIDLEKFWYLLLFLQLIIQKGARKMHGNYGAVLLMT